MTETTTPDVTEQEADVEQEGGLSLNKNIIEHKGQGVKHVCACTCSSTCTGDVVVSLL